ncbi:hypothetical protein [Thalassobacillus sp. CUG 92003]|uniref:hypothetical protein n=1 Tax=Thalassobacillus sp. CUG 92003 TaxID=2736641 RepID=UPI0015E7AFDD|nr:hypothetical protein [Thalassobacillus sp. CUG 92003]
MKKNMKIVVAMLFSFSLMLVGFGASSVSAESESGSVNSPDDYINYLEEKMAQKSNLLSSDSELQSGQALEDFKKLPKKKQEKFVDYLNDADLFEEALGRLKTINQGESVTLQNGDVVVSETGSLGNDDVRLASTRWNMWSEYTIEMFGLDVVITRAEGSYDANSYRVLDTVSGGGYVVRQLNPTVNMDKLNETHYMSSGYAYGEVSFSYEIGTPWEGVQIGTITHYVYGDEDGYVDGHAYRNP